MLTVFFGFQGVVHFENLPLLQTVNEECYHFAALEECSTSNGQNYVPLIHGFCMTIIRHHIELGKWWIIWPNRKKILSNSHHIHNIWAPCDFSLFPKLKLLLRAKRFEPLEEVKENVTKEWKPYLHRPMKIAWMNGWSFGIHVSLRIVVILKEVK